MSTPTLDPTLATAVENELSALGTKGSRLQRHQRRARGAAVAVGTVALAGMITGGAIIINSFPGETTTSPLGSVVTGTFDGTASIDLGPVPPGAGAVILDVTCTDGGTITVPTVRQDEFVSWECSNPIRKDTAHIVDAQLPDPGTTSITITADAGTRWSVAAQYASRTAPEWEVNANGQTYGVPNDSGSPDLTPAYATNGEVGYILVADLFKLPVGAEGSINVYKSDGTTVIGQFHVGNS
jgi:hypothetical protein